MNERNPVWRLNDRFRSSDGLLPPGSLKLNGGLIPRPALSLVIFGLIFFGANGCKVQGPEPVVKETGQEKAIPHSLVAEHEALHQQLQDAINSGGETGEAANLVADRLRPHFLKEEEYALPPLTLLAPLSQGRSDDHASEIMKLSEKLSAELPQMLNEHKAITLALDDLDNSARKENKPAAMEFAERLRQHARMEEEILYPSAILVGKYLKLLPVPTSTQAR